MQWKGEIPSGQVYDRPVSSFDIFATAAANSAGVTAPEQVEGVDLIPYLTGKNDGNPHETLFWRQGGKTALRHGDWKLVRMGKRLVAGKANWELYDLSKDISEENNLAAAEPERLAELVEIWEKQNSEMSEPLF
jgi:arylsulfatase B